MSVYIESGFTGITYPLSHGRICWNSIARRSTVVGSTEVAGFGAINAGSPFTYSYWQPAAIPATLTMTLSSSEPVSYVAFTGHDFGTAGADFEVELFVSGIWVSVSSVIAPESDSDIVVLFDRRGATAVRVTFDTAIPTVAVMAAGDVIEIPQPQYASVGAPVDLANETEFMTNRTLRNSYVGRSIMRQRNVNKYPVSNVTETWVRSTLAPFIEDAVSYPFFLAERPDGYPDAVSYRWSKTDIQPQRIGQANLMKFTL